MIPLPSTQAPLADQNGRPMPILTQFLAALTSNIPAAEVALFDKDGNATRELQLLLQSVTDRPIPRGALLDEQKRPTRPMTLLLMGLSNGG